MPPNGMVDLYKKIAPAPEPAGRSSATCTPAREHRPELAMVDLAKASPNFHLAQRDDDRRRLDAGDDPPGRQDVGADGRLSKAVMPESTFARIYQEMINFQMVSARSIPKPWASVPERRPDGPVAAEEYGSHDKTFEIPGDGVANITDRATATVL